MKFLVTIGRGAGEKLRSIQDGCILVAFFTDFPGLDHRFRGSFKSSIRNGETTVFIGHGFGVAVAADPDQIVIGDIVLLVHDGIGQAAALILAGRDRPLVIRLLFVADLAQIPGSQVALVKDWLLILVFPSTGA